MTALAELRPYQLRPLAAVLSAVLRGRGGTFSVQIARQGGKNELSAHLELLVLAAFADRGGSIIKCAPTFHPQLRVSFLRLRDRCTALGLWPALLRAAGRRLEYGAASLTFLSAAPGAQVVGHTASLLLECDEAQDVDPEKFDRDFRPMAAAANAVTVFYGVGGRRDSLLERVKAETITHERATGEQRHFSATWREVARHVPAYGRYVESERRRLGERHPLFLSQYCLVPFDGEGMLLDAAALAALRGSHPRRRAPATGETYAAGLDLGGAGAGEHDRTALAIGTARGGAVEVVELRTWQGRPYVALVDELAALLRAWRVRRVAVDATGLGGPLADALGRAARGTAVVPVAYTAARKSALGDGLLAAALGGRLRLFADDGSAESRALWHELTRARAERGTAGRLAWGVPDREGHDDLLHALALLVAAAGGVEPERRARGFVRGEPQRE